MTDTDTGWGHENDLSSSSISVTGGTISGSYRAGASRYTHIYDSFVCGVGSTIPTFPALGMSGSIKALVPEVAKSHPGSPPMSIPNFLYELKDLPKMLMHAGEKAKILEDAANAKSKKDVLKHLYSDKAIAKDWLNYNFGWAPFVSDVKDLGGIATWLDRRLRALNGKRSIRTSGELGELIGKAQNRYSYGAGYLSYKVQRDFYHSQKEWWVAHWRVNQLTLAAIMDSPSALALNAAGAADLPSVIWNAMPWSWLTDWVADVGSLMETYSNQLGVTLSSVNHMKHTKREVFLSQHPDSGSYPPMEPGHVMIDTKWRSSSLPTIFNSVRGLDVLTPSKLATLGSLGVTRIKI